MGRVPWAAFLAGHTVTNVLQYGEIAVLGRWTLEDQGRRLYVKEHQPVEKVGSPYASLLRDRLYFGYFFALSTRHTATPFEVRNVPPFASKNPAYVPSCLEEQR